MLKCFVFFFTLAVFLNAQSAQPPTKAVPVELVADYYRADAQAMRAQIIRDQALTAIKKACGESADPVEIPNTSTMICAPKSQPAKSDSKEAPPETKK